MPVLFWDASALIKHYVPEKGSDSVTALLKGENASDFQMVTTIIGYAEAFSILQRKRRGGVIHQAALTEALSALEFDLFDSERFIMLSINDGAIMAGVDLMTRKNLHSSDAAILASFLAFKSGMRVGTVCRLVSCDNYMVRAAQTESLLSINPEMISLEDVSTLVANCCALET